MKITIGLFAWLFLARTLVRAALSSRSRGLLARAHTSVQNALRTGSEGALETARGEIAAPRAALARLADLAPRWRGRLLGE